MKKTLVLTVFGAASLAGLMLFQNATTPSVRPEAYGAVGDGVADDTEEIQRALNSGSPVRLGTNKRYLISRRLDLRQNSMLYSDGTATIVMGPGFTNTDMNARKGVRTVGIGGYNVSGIRLQNFKITTQGRLDHAYLKAVYLQNTTAPLVEGLDISGFGVGGGIITVESATGGTIRNNHIHDCTTNAAVWDPARGMPQITGIEVDNDRYGGTPSTNLRITGNRIHRLIPGPAFLARYGYQTDGINIAHHTSRGHRIENNQVSLVGEGIDHFGAEAVIRGNTFTDLSAFGIKLIHGAQNNLVENNTVSQAGYAGVVLWSMDLNVSGNVIRANNISRVGQTSLPIPQAYDRDRVAGVVLVDGEPNAGGELFGNRVEMNTITAGQQMALALLCTRGRDNSFVGNAASEWRLAYARNECTNTLVRASAGGLTSILATVVDNASAPRMVESIVPFGRELRDATNEWETSVPAYYPGGERTVNVRAAARTPSAGFGKNYRLTLRKNGVAVHSVTKTQQERIGDFQVVLEHRLRVLRGDRLEVWLWHNDDTAVPLAPASSTWNFLTVDEVP